MAVQRNNIVLLADARAVREVSDKQLGPYMASYDQVMMPSDIEDVSNDMLRDTLLYKGQREMPDGKKVPEYAEEWLPILTSANPADKEKRRQLVAMFHATQGTFHPHNLTVMGIDKDLHDLIRLHPDDNIRNSLTGMSVTQHMETYKEKNPMARNDMLYRLMLEGRIKSTDPFYYNPNVSQMMLPANFDSRQLHDYETELTDEVATTKLKNHMGGDGASFQRLQLQFTKKPLRQKDLLTGKKSVAEVTSATRDEVDQLEWERSQQQHLRAVQQSRDLDEKRQGHMTATAKLKKVMKGSTPEVEAISQDDVEKQTKLGRDRGTGIDFG